MTKVTPSFDISTENIQVGDDETVTVTLPDDATGTVTLTIDGKEYTATVENGKATFVIPGIKAGEHKVNVAYSGDDKYAPAKGSDSFTVSKVKPDMGMDAPEIKVGQDGVITVTVPEDATGTISITVDGKTYTASIKDGKAVFHISGLGPGTHIVKAYYSGDGKYLAGSVDGTIVVEPKNGTSPQDKGKAHGGIDLESKKTGNPILVLFMVLFSLILIPIKRRRDDDEEEENEDQINRID